MKAVILAAGKGVRMHPLTLEKPKPLLEVLGKPLLHHVWESLPDIVDEVILAVGYKQDMIRNYFGEEFLGKKVTYVEQLEQKGTGHALHLCRSYLGNDDKFLFLFSDDIYDKKTLSECAKHDRVMLVGEVPNPERFGVVLTDSHGKLTDFEEKPAKPKSNLVSTGAFVLDKKIFDYELELDPRGEYFLTSLVQKLAREHGMLCKKADLWIPVGYPEDLKKAEELLKN